MSIKQAVQDAMKDAMKARDTVRLECLRMAKGALLLKEKEGAKDVALSDEDAIKALRSEVKKRQQSIETFRELGKDEEVQRLEKEIEVIESFLPKQLSEDALEAKVREYLAANPDVNHAGKLTGVLKKELGDQADGKVLNTVVKRVLEA